MSDDVYGDIIHHDGFFGQLCCTVSGGHADTVSIINLVIISELRWRSRYHGLWEVSRLER